MAPHLSKDLRDRVVNWRMEHGLSYRELANLAKCSIGTISNIFYYHSTYGQSTNPLSERIGRPRLLDDGDMTFLDQLLDREPTLYLDEILVKLEEARNASISIATLQRGLVRLDITRKSISKEAKERNDYLHAIWEADMAQYDDPDVFVFLDESVVNNQSTQQFAGWSHRGVPCIRRASFVYFGHAVALVDAITGTG
jgi:transposase